MQKINRKDIPHLKKHPYLRQKSKAHKTKEVCLTVKNIKNDEHLSMKYKENKEMKQNMPIANVLAFKPVIQQRDPSLSFKHNITSIQTDIQSNQINYASITINAQLQDYIQDIEDYISNRKRQSNINYQYLHNHKILTYKLRSYFVRHIFKLYKKFNLKRTTLYLSVQYMDLYFSINNSFNDQFQIISAVQACLFMAMKYQEIYPPSLRDWVDRRNINQIINIQANILKALNFELNQQTSENHLQYIVSIQKQNILNSEQINNARFLLDLCLFDVNMRQYPSQKLAKNVHNMFNKPQFCDENIVKNIRWMIERNKPSIEWLIDNIHKDIHISNII